MSGFEEHWKNNFIQDLPESKKKSAEAFLRPLISYFEKTARKNIKILDAGCGDGVHAVVFAEHRESKKDYHYIGCDLSLEALKISKQRIRENCGYVQGDMGKIPFENDAFDAIISFGVLAYTTNPYQSFVELCRTLKSGGLIGIWVFPRVRGVVGFLFSWVRHLCLMLGGSGTRLIADSIVPFLWFLPTRSNINLSNASWKQCREIVLVNIAPEQLFFPDPLEVEGWFKNNSMKIIHQDSDAPITLWGQKYKV